MRTIYVVFGSRQQAQIFARLNGIHPHIVFSADDPDSLRGHSDRVIQVENNDRPYLIQPDRAKRWKETRRNIKLIEMTL